MGQPDFSQNEGSCLAWLYEVARRKSQSHFRTLSRHIDSECLENFENILLDPDEQYDDEDQEVVYRRSLRYIQNRLRPKDAKLFELLIVREMRQCDAADLLGIKVDTLKMRWHRLKPKINDIIQNMRRDGTL